MYPDDRPETAEAWEHQEGESARMIENETAKLPSDIFLWAGLGVLGTVACMQLAGRRHGGLMVGQLAAPLLLMGVYNKLVKVAGSNRTGIPTQ